MNVKYSNKKEFYDYIFDKSEVANFPLCTETILSELSSIENFFVDLVFWHRNHKRGFQYCISNKFFVGALGFIIKNRIWSPTGLETCDHFVGGPWGVEVGDKKASFDPYYQKRHCNPLCHVAYLVKHRAAYIIPRITRNLDLPKLLFLYEHYSNNDLPLLFNHTEDDWRETIIQDFAKEYFTIVVPERQKFSVTEESQYVLNNK